MREDHFFPDVVFKNNFQFLSLSVAAAIVHFQGTAIAPRAATTVIDLQPSDPGKSIYRLTICEMTCK